METSDIASQKGVKETQPSAGKVMKHFGAAQGPVFERKLLLVIGKC
jgi:hypothetical protein